jgi:hypothetical protein
MCHAVDHARVRACSAADVSLRHLARTACVLPRVTRQTAGILVPLAGVQVAEAGGEVGQDPRDPQAHEGAHLGCPVDGPVDGSVLKVEMMDEIRRLTAVK